ncbi:MAG: aminopeptidase, partial [Muribaculaceae bacterium]|nr:aminopeptidase [Muribaculaceae bacterium]
MPVAAQNRAKGGIDADMMRQILQASTASGNKALSNAMAANSIDDLAKNYRNTTISDTHFSIETPKQSIHNQRSSGRCWMYSS